jgi:hypothetical protein
MPVLFVCLNGSLIVRISYSVENVSFALQEARQLVAKQTSVSASLLKVEMSDYYKDILLSLIGKVVSVCYS